MQGKLAGLFFNQSGTVLFFICIAIYLYGDLAIYGAAVGKSLRDTVRNISFNINSVLKANVSLFRLVPTTRRTCLATRRSTERSPAGQAPI